MFTVLHEDSSSYSVVIDPQKIEIQVEYDGPTRDEFGWRNGYTLNIRTEQTRYTDNTLRSGVGGEIDARHMWATAVSFLSACEESRDYSARGHGPGENSHLFPGWVMDIVSPHMSDLEIHAYEIENPEED